MRITGASPATLAGYFAQDMATESELLARIDRAQDDVVAAVRDERLAAYGRRAMNYANCDPNAVHERLDPKLFLGPRVIDLDGWVREDTSLPDSETQGYRGPYFDLVQFMTVELAALWPLYKPGEVASNRTVAAEGRLKNWLAKEMRGNQETPRSKSDMLTEARAAGYAFSARAFSRAWAASVRESGAAKWSRPGRKS